MAHTSSLSDHTGDFVHGFLLTLQISFIAFGIALVLGTVLAVMRVSPLLPLRAFGTGYVETLRNTPLLVLLLLIVFGLPEIGITFGLVTSGVIGLGCYEASFLCEAVRGGINTVPVGQAEAARALGLRGRQVLTTVVLPQAMRAVVQPIGQRLINLILNSSLVAAIGVTDITGVANHVDGEVVQPIPIYIGASIAYLVLTSLVSQVTGFVERRVAIVR